MEEDKDVKVEYVEKFPESRDVSESTVKSLVRFVVKTLNEKYDAVREPWRFLLVLSVASPLILVIQVSQGVPRIVGSITLLLLILWRTVYHLSDW